VIDAREFLKSFEDGCDPELESDCNSDKNCLKQYVANKIMEKIEDLHIEAETHRLMTD
jgi:hypothetical protein